MTNPVFFCGVYLTVSGTLMVFLYDIPFCLWDIPVRLWDIPVSLWESMIVCGTSMFVSILPLIKTCLDCCLLRLFFTVMAAYASNF